ncbi:MAG TPA: hypothetical protein VGZ00_04075 [Candidatus Baltobacteraceae bacterium]|jgi:type IV secretion system protein VirB4|nr:hypothetical protein [Candidatus Baltobacteraceae bacterium]
MNELSAGVSVDTWSHVLWIGITILAVVLGMGAVFFEVGSFQKGISLKERRNRYRIAHANLLQYRRLVRPDLVKLANGAFLAVFEIAAPDAHSYDAQGLASSDVGLAKALSQFNERMIVHMHLRHDKYFEYDERLGEYPHPILAWLDERRREFFQSGMLSRSRRLVSVAWLPQSEKAEKFRAAISVGDDAALRSEDDIIAEFEGELTHIAEFFRSYGVVRRLGELRQADRFGIMRRRSEILEHLAWCISGKDKHILVPHAGQALNGLLAENFRGGFDVRVGNMETRVVAFKGFPQETIPLALARLAELDTDYSLIVRWLPMSGRESKKILNDAYTEWITKSSESSVRTDIHSLQMAQSANEAISLVAAGVRFGLVSPYLIFRDADRKKVDEAAHHAVALLDEIGFASFVTTLSSEDDYFAGLPGDGYHGVRRYPLSSVNVTHLFSFHEESPGRRFTESPTLPRRQPAVAYTVAGPDEHLYHLHLNDEPRDIFHHMGVGSTGSGKSVLLAFLALQWVGRMPYAGFTGIDRGRSLYRATRFLDGKFYDVLGEVDSPGFALFSDLEDEQIRRELLDILDGFCELQGVTVTPARRQALETAIDRISELPPHVRSLTTFYDLVQDPEDILRPALLNYTKTGSLGKTLDCSEDSFQLGLFSVVEIGRIFSMSSKYLIPVLTVVFWKARNQVRRLKARTGNFDYHWLFEIDEAHTFLGHPLGQKFVQELLKMGRKEKMALGLWSNAATDFANSPICNDILEACKTRFFFRNLDVLEDEQTRLIYSALGLSKRGIEILPYMPTYSMMFNQPASRELQVLKLGLDRSWLAIIGRSRDSDNRRLDDYIQRYPKTWREELLRYEGVEPRKIDDLIERLNQAKRISEDFGMIGQVAS